MQSFPLPEAHVESAVSVAPERWMSLVDAIERLATTQTLEEVIAVVRETARSISGADGVTFVLRDADSCHYIEEDAVGPLWKGKRFPLTACISGWCMLNAQKAVISDIYADPRIPHDAYRPTFVKSLVMVPVQTDVPIAAIGAYWGDKREFDDGEIALLEALARSTAAAITAVKMRASLRESEERLGWALRAGRLGAWELDLETGRLTASAMCKANFGYPAEVELCFDDLVAAMHPGDRRNLKEAFADAVARHADLRIECRSVNPDGHLRWIVIRGHAVPNANGGPARMSGVTIDLSEQREAKERMDRLQSDIAHIGRLTEMGQMVSAFAHELRQPLTAANNYLSAAKRLLAREDATSARAIEMIEKADGQFVRATQIIQRIRNFATKTEVDRAAENVGALIAEAASLAQLDPRHRGVNVRLDVAGDLPPALVDKVQIQQVLLNLLRNAFEATEGRKTRTVIAAARVSDDGLQIKISVTDTGPGLAPDVAAKLFQPFVTTKDSGMGVGLSICRTIVEAHGGKMWADSEPGQGAVFCFTIPIADTGV